MKSKDLLVKSWRWFLRILMSAIHTLRIYPAWAKTYRRLSQKKYNGVDLDLGLSPREAQNKMNTISWHRDTWREAWDSVGSPQWVQHCIDEVGKGNPQPAGALDCDDFTSWAVNVIDPIYEPFFFGQGWSPIKGNVVSFKSTGHAVCVVRMKDTGKLYHCGNWGFIGPFDTLSDVGDFICGNDLRTRTKRGKPLAWCLYTPDMRLVDKGNGLPPQSIPSSM